MPFLFVYGTLKRGGCRHHFLNGAHFCGSALTRPDYRLFSLGDYPGLISAAGGQGIEGELYRVDERGAAMLDVVEGVDERWFVRKPVLLQSPHAEIDAEAYFFLGSTVGCRELVRRWENS